MSEKSNMEAIVSLCKRRGFIYPSSEIYGGFASTYDLGPLGSLLAENIKKVWRTNLVQKRKDISMLDGAIFCHPRTWEASGHVDSFNDPLVEDKITHIRYRADHLIEDQLDMDTSSMSFEEMSKIIEENELKSPDGNDLTELKSFNLMMKAEIGSTDESKSEAFLRGETCQIIFLQYKNLLNFMRNKLPFGVLQIGKAFRNEVTTKQFILRTREFQQIEFEYFVSEKESFKYYEEFKQLFIDLLSEKLGIEKEKIRYRKIPNEEMSHYAKEQYDLEIKLSDDKWQEISPLNHRGDWDLSRHGEFSGVDMNFTNSDTKEKFIPNVLETSFGLERLLYVLLDHAYKEETIKDSNGKEETRIVLKLKPSIAPITLAILPLMKKDGMPEMATKIFDDLSDRYMVDYDESGSIGKRYRRNDEIGTPFCVTVDYESLEDDTVTVRHRDSMEQERVKIDDLEAYIIKKLN